MVGGGAYSARLRVRDGRGRLTHRWHSLFVCSRYGAACGGPIGPKACGIQAKTQTSTAARSRTSRVRETPDGVPRRRTPTP